MSRIHLHTHGHERGHGPGADGQTQEPPWSRRLELVITVALGLAAIVGAFAAYKNEQRNHDATVQFSEGIRNFDDAGQFYATGNATFTHDQTLFLEYAKAIQQKDGQLASYIFANLMDPVLQASVKWWQSPANTAATHPARTPFTAANPNFGIPQVSAAQHSTSASKGNFAEAKTQQNEADHFTLVEVILATALFLYGIAGVSRNLTLKIGALATGAVIFLFSLGLLITG